MIGDPQNGRSKKDRFQDNECGAGGPAASSRSLLIHLSPCFSMP